MTRADVVAEALAWIGTPYVTGGALRGAGADCIGLVEGVGAAMSGRPRSERPPWRRDWAAVTDLAQVAAAAGFTVLADPAEALPGDVVALALTRASAPHHLAIVTSPATIVHAWVGRGVIETHLAALAPRVALAARFPPP